jgi:choline dehydrogenase
MRATPASSWKRRIRPIANSSYDLIIAGAGSAGCVLANRLSADGKRRVLLLEAGGKDSKLEVRIPAAFSKLFKSKVDWAFSTEPQPHLNNRRLFVPRGRLLGGSSSINAMIYIRGHRRDYDEWGRLAGSVWSWDSVSPYFHASAELSVDDLRCVNPLTRIYIEAAESIGIKRNDDFNGAVQEGAGMYRVTQKNGRRWSTADAFLRPALSRPNLTLRTNAPLARVTFDGTRASGVELTSGERIAAGEVILAAGSIGSPHLLMLSGVGPADALGEYGIDVVADSPDVGANLQDHPICGITLHSKKRITLDIAETIPNFLRWLFLHNGPLTSNVAEGAGFVRTRDDLDAPDIQLLFAPAWFVDHGFTRPPGCGFSIGATLLTPKSRGRITLRSNNPLDAPAIDGNFFSDPADMTTMLRGMQICRDIIRAKAFDEFRGAELMPGDDVVDMTEHVRNTCEMLYHPVGTCRMGSDDASVVDPQLRVRGVERLRVIDASVMPVIVRGNTNAPTIMIAERAAGWV